MKRPALALILCLLFTAASYAQSQQNSSASSAASGAAAASAAPAGPDSPATREDVNRFLDAMHTRDMMSSMVTMMSKQMTQMVHQQVSKNQSLPPDAEARIDKMMEDTMKNLPIDDLIQAMIPVYQRHFTKGDIDAFVAFYSTGSGQKMLKEMPAITAESMQASMGIMQKMMANMQQQVQADIAQMQKDSSPTPK